jgi:hypothetical protein
MVVVDPNDTIHQLDGQEFTTNQHSNKIKRAQSSINPSTDSPVNALKVGHSQDQGNNNESSPSQNKVVAKYPLVAKFLSIQPSIIQQA